VNHKIILKRINQITNYLFIFQAIDTIQKTGNGHNMSLKFVKYAQSSQCKSMRDSSVSYASAALVIEWLYTKPFTTFAFILSQSCEQNLFSIYFFFMYFNLHVDEERIIVYVLWSAIYYYLT
jgi:hypothetical protein